MISTSNLSDTIKTAIANYEPLTLQEVYAMWPDETNLVAAIVCSGKGPLTESEFIDAVLALTAKR